MRPNPTFRQVAPWIVAAGAALAFGLAADMQDPASPTYRQEPVGVSTSVPPGPPPDLVDVEVTGSEPVICGERQTLNDAGDGCVDLPPEPEVTDTPPMEATDRVEFFEDGSWRNHSDGTTGCTPGGLCDDDTPRIEYFEDGSWRNHTDGTTGCTPGSLCDD